MNKAAADYVGFAHAMLDRAAIMADADLPEDAARTAYMACFHAAQALIVAKTGHVPKTHRGVQSEFTRLTHGVATVDRELRNFLSDSYEFKSHADYFSGPVDAISDDDAIEAIETARRFVAHFAALIDTDNPT